MKTIVPAFFVMILCGCSQSHSVSRDDLNMWLHQARKDLLDENATVTTTDGLSLDGTVVGLNEDSVVVRDGDSETAIDLRSVASIGTSGSIIAPVLGVIGGAALGGAIGYAMAGEPDPSKLDLFHGVGETIVGGFIGGFWGGFLGAAVTMGDNYELQSVLSEEGEILSVKGETLSIKGKGARGNVTFSFDVTIEPSGRAVGTFFANAPGIVGTKGNVHCGSVNGHIGVFGGVIDGTGNPFTIMVSDEPDGIIIGIGQPDCNTSGFLTPVPITEGEITIEVGN